MLYKQIELAASRAREPEARDLEVINNRAAAEGLGRSGAWVIQRHERRLQTLQDLLALRLKLERETPLAPEDAQSWHRELIGSIHGITDRHTGHITEGLERDWQTALGGPLPEELRDRLSTDLKTLRNQYLQEADILRDERELAPRAVPSKPAQITLNIGQSQIANLNLGTMIGNIQNTVGGLQDKGLQQLAEAIKELTEAVVDEAALSGKAKQDAVEAISVIGEEATKPEPQRRLAVLRWAGSALWELVKNVDKLQTAYSVLKEILKAKGISLGV